MYLKYNSSGTGQGSNYINAGIVDHYARGMTVSVDNKFFMTGTGSGGSSFFTLGLPPRNLKTLWELRNRQNSIT